VRFRAGATLLAELEPGDFVLILLSGAAQVSVSGGGRERRELGRLGPGDACGEVSVLSRDLRSATVVALEEVEALRLERGEFLDLIGRRPAIAAYFTRLLAERLAANDAALDAILAESDKTEAVMAGLAGQVSATVPGRSGVRRAWRELVVAGGRELPLLSLLSFLGTLAAVRGLVDLSGARGETLFVMLRSFYTLGMAMVFASTATSLVRYRPKLQRAVAMVFGAGFALLLNELSVFLAFDVFWLDMTTPDPTQVLDVEVLYRRTESLWALALMAGLLLALAFTRRFLHRLVLLAMARLRGA
jgi:hypothetical protein